jgi:hypothetical protein
MLTDSQIHELSRRMNIPLEGCFFKDELPKKIYTNKTYIINLQDGTDDEGNHNEGTHWTMLQVNETPNGTIEPIYFDPYGQEPPEAVKKAIKDNFNLYLPYNKKDVQSLMNNACGFYCLALSHFINFCKLRTGHFYQDVEEFIDMFDDLNTSVDWKKNEYILKMFFQSEDESKRKKIDVLSHTHDDYERILNEDEKGGIDLMRIPIDTKLI